jgi:mRNA interferase HigB
MHVISRKALWEFGESHRDAELPLRQWEAIVKRADWQDWADLKVSGGSAHKVEKYIVFNVGGNKYRLIAMVSDPTRKVHILRVVDPQGLRPWHAERRLRSGAQS